MAPMRLMAVNIPHAVLFLVIASLRLASAGHNQHFSRVHRDAPAELTFRRYPQTNVSAREVQTILSTTGSLKKRYIQFLYGEGYEDLVNNLTKLLFNDYIGLVKLKNDGAESTLDQLLHSPGRDTILVFLDSPVEVIHVFSLIKKRMLKSHLVNWVLIMEGEEPERDVVFLEDFVHEGTKVQILTRKPSGSFRLFYSEVDANGTTRFKRLAKWTNAEDIEKKRLPEPRKYSVNGRHMTVGVKESLLSLKISKAHADRSVELESGLDVAILNTLSASLNFTYRAVLPPDNLWGNPQPDGRITGIIGMLARREASFGISAMVSTASREEVVDFTAPYFFTRMMLFSRSPKEKSRAFSVLSTFRFEVWLCIIASLLLMSPVFHAISSMSAALGADTVKESLQWCAFNLFRSIVSQGNFLHAQAWPKRFFLIFWFLFCAICSALYSGTLTAVLAAPADEKPIDSLEDLPRAVKEGFTVGIMEDTSTEYYFRTATEGSFKRTWGLFNHEDRSKSFVNGPETGLRRVLEEKFVFIIVDSYCYAFAMRYGIQNFHFGRNTLLPIATGIACQEGSPFKDTFSHMLLRLRETGIVGKWMDDEYRRVPRDRSPTDSGGHTFAVTLTHIQAAFYVVLLGYCFALLVLLIEIAFCLLKEGKVSHE